MNGVLGHDSTLVRLYWAGVTQVNEVNLIMKHVPGAGSIARPVDQQSSALPLYHGCLLLDFRKKISPIAACSWIQSIACCNIYTYVKDCQGYQTDRRDVYYVLFFNIFDLYLYYISHPNNVVHKAQRPGSLTLQKNYNTARALGNNTNLDLGII